MENKKKELLEQIKLKQGTSFKQAVVIGVLFGICIILGLFHLSRSEQEPKVIFIEQQEPDHKKLNHKKLNQENVLYWLNYFEVQYPEIVLAQSIQECGWQYDSYRATEMNNIFGFQNNTGALTFGHWIGSVIYYKKWQDTYYQQGNYLEFLHSYGYAQDSSYTSKLKKIVKIIETE
jgi:hypothetical protein